MEAFLLVRFQVVLVRKRVYSIQNRRFSQAISLSFVLSFCVVIFGGRFKFLTRISTEKENALLRAFKSFPVQNLVQCDHFERVLSIEVKKPKTLMTGNQERPLNYSHFKKSSHSRPLKMCLMTIDLVYLWLDYKNIRSPLL